MNELRQFLRYLTPGLILVGQSLFLTWLIFPKWTSPILSVNPSSIVFGVLGAGSLGYVCATLHHSASWWIPSQRRVIGYDETVARLTRLKLIDAAEASAGADGIDQVLVLWHSRAETSPIIKGANTRVNSLTDIAHGAGAARVAAILALASPVAVGLTVGGFDLTVESALRTGGAATVGAAMIWLFHDTWHRTGRLVGTLISNALELELRTHPPLLILLREPQATSTTVP